MPFFTNLSLLGVSLISGVALYFIVTPYNSQIITHIELSMFMFLHGVHVLIGSELIENRNCPSDLNESHIGLVLVGGAVGNYRRSMSIGADGESLLPVLSLCFLCVDGMQPASSLFILACFSHNYGLQPSGATN
jgi:hypothetical protein